MNIQMLVWGAQHAGPARDLRMDMNPQTTWLEMAKAHARQVGAAGMGCPPPRKGRAAAQTAASRAAAPRACCNGRTTPAPAASHPCPPTSLPQVAANHVREDGSTYHIVEYNPNTGAVNKKYTYQGHSANSTWARGQAWAIAGFGMLATATGEEEFAAVGRRLADAYLARMSAQAASAGGAAEAGVGGAEFGAAAAAGAGTEEEDPSGDGAGAGPWDGFVPVWDFDAPHYPELDGPRDTSAAAVAALGLLHLSEACGRGLGGGGGGPGGASECTARYMCAATNTLRALASDKYLSPPSEAGFPALLRHATGGFPLRSHVDVGLISGDYYFLAALAKCAAMPDCLAA
jgi:unsaturated chondroitin disaccharide hydrolase